MRTTRQTTNQLTLASMNNMTRHNVYMHAFAQLPDTFTVYDFTKLVKFMGGTEKDVMTHQTRPFLERVAKRDSMMTWSKKKMHLEGKKAVEETPLQQVDITTHDDVEKAIDLLKSKGYRVMKPKTEWEEL